MSVHDRALIESASAPIAAEQFRVRVELDVLREQMQALVVRVAELRQRDRELERELVDVVSRIREGSAVRTRMRTTR